MSAAFALSICLGLAGAQEPPAPEPVPVQEEKAEEKKDPEPAPADQEKRDEPAPAPGDVQGPPAPAANPVQDALNAPAVEPPPAAPRHASIEWPLDGERIAQHLRDVASKRPDLATLETLGRSAGGREILALRLTAPARPESAPERPTLLVLDFQGTASAGPEAMLELAWTLVERFDTDERVRTLLGRTALVLAPALDPDARASAPARRSGVQFERNFPSGWQPASLREGSGRVSLSEPETLAAARFLTGLKQAAVVLGFTPARPAIGPYPEAELPEEDRAVFTRLVAALALEGAAPIVPWPESGSPGGGPYDFAYQARGIYPLLIRQPSAEELAAGRLAGFGAEVSERVLRCLAFLPRVEVAQEGLERLAGDTWQLDVRFQNAGLVPTQSALARRRMPGCEVNLRLEGAKVVATARKPDGGGTYKDAAMDASFQVRSSLGGGTLAGGEGRGLRLILAGSSGAEVRLTAGAPWAGSSALSVLLP